MSLIWLINCPRSILAREILGCNLLNESLAKFHTYIRHSSRSFNTMKFISETKNKAVLKSRSFIYIYETKIINILKFTCLIYKTNNPILLKFKSLICETKNKTFLKFESLRSVTKFRN